MLTLFLFAVSSICPPPNLVVLKIMYCTSILCVVTPEFLPSIINNVMDEQHQKLTPNFLSKLKCYCSNNPTDQLLVLFF